jgi:F0F1-type ATP synthase assembly protein I
MLQLTSRYSYVGIFFGVAICIGFFGGHWLDRRWHTEPWLSIAGLLIGVASGFRELYRLTKMAARENRKK